MQLRQTSLIGLAATTALVIGAVAAPAGSVHSPKDRNYAIGHDLGVNALQRMAEDRVAIDPESLIAGFRDAVRRQQPAIDPVDMQQILSALEREVLARLAEARMQEDPVFRTRAASNLKRSVAFHAEFSEVDGVTTLPSGVQYRVIEPGEGRQPADEDIVTISFSAELIDGRPAFSDVREDLRVENMLPGGREVLRLMRPGARWIVAIPPERALGLAGRPPQIGPNETIIVDVTLVGIK
ncbi:MAG: FKBP-type peptidyl-prolyl cis-trans isomerase N-terminal domain-containing protein [Planctomycetota bacterium]